MTDDRETRDQAGTAGPAGGNAAADGANGAAAATDSTNGAAGAGAGDGSIGLAGAGAPEAAGQGEEAPASGGDLVAEVERMQREISALTDRHLRLAAEFDNYRKRVAREQSEQHNRSQAELARRVLDALDDLQRVEHFDPAQVTTDSLLKALELVERKFRQALESAGLEEIRAEGEPFNPELMEALMTAPAEHPEEDEVVADVFQKGYRMGNTLVRPARVRVKKYEG